MGSDSPPSNKPVLIAKTVDSHSAGEVRRDVGKVRKRGTYKAEVDEG